MEEKEENTQKEQIDPEKTNKLCQEIQKYEPEKKDYEYNEIIDILDENFREVPIYWAKRSEESEELARTEISRFIPPKCLGVFPKNDEEEEHEMIFTVDKDFQNEEGESEVEDLAGAMLRRLL